MGTALRASKVPLRQLQRFASQRYARRIPTRWGYDAPTS